MLGLGEDVIDAVAEDILHVILGDQERRYDLRVGFPRKRLSVFVERSECGEVEVQEVEQTLVVDVLVVLPLLLSLALSHSHNLLLELNEHFVGEDLLEPLYLQGVLALPDIPELGDNIQSIALLDVR